MKTSIMKTLARTRLLLAAVTFLSPAGVTRAQDESHPLRDVTFTVDRNLSSPKGHLPLIASDSVASEILNANNLRPNVQHVVATSFEGEQLAWLGQDVFFSCLVQAYADHRPVVLSPDIIWTLISQGFARYVNAHAEELRPMIVSHEGQKELKVKVPEDLLSDKADWSQLLDGMAAQIATNTKDDIVSVITSDFSTTGVTERIASQITLMESMKKYFKYKALYGACGIPSVTLRGIADDWRRVLTKTRQLARYGMQKWVGELTPVLEEFVRAAEGEPDTHFWRSIVKQERVDSLIEGDRCGSKRPTIVDGWFLRFLVNEEGETPQKRAFNASMPSEMVSVDFRYVETDLAGNPLSETPMQLWAGLVGVEENQTTYALTPKIGWLVRKSDAREEEEYNFSEMSMGGYVTYHNLDSVPAFLRHHQNIPPLTLEFRDRVVLPEWIDELNAKDLTIKGAGIAEAENLRKIRKVSKLLLEYTDSVVVPQWVGEWQLEELTIRGQRLADGANLQGMKHLKSLWLTIEEETPMPEWMLNLPTDHLNVKMKGITKEQEKQLRAKYSNVFIER
jgi:hypothetical protein